ncbi:P-loop NTPase, partial [Limnothrix redekei]
MAKKALVIGISKFDDVGFQSLTCDRDLERVSAWFQAQNYDVKIAPELCDQETQETYPDPRGKLNYNSLRNELRIFLTETAKGSELAVVYIASHGYLKKDDNDEPMACLVASNTPKDKENKNNTYQLASLARLFKDADVDNLVGIFDFCHSGAINELIEEIEISFRQQKNYVLLAACHASQSAFDTQEGGVFTTALLEGMSAQNADEKGRITAAKLCDFVRTRLGNSGQTARCFPGKELLELGRYDRADIEAARVAHGTTVDPQPERVLEPPGGFRRVAKLVDQAQSIQPSQTQFYEATAPHWSDIKANCDAPRDLYAEVKQFAVERLDPKHWAIGLPDENLGFRQPSVPLGVIVGRGGEGKSTLLMRVAADLAAEGYEVWWREERLSGLNVAALAAMPQPDRPVLVCADELLPGDEEELRAGLMQLYRQTVPLVLLGTVRQELWRGQIEGRTKREAEIVRFEFGDLSQPELGAIVAKLEAAGRLGQLAELEPDKRVEQLLTKADGQLLILLCEVFDREGIKALVQKNLDALKKQQPDGACVVDACEYVALLHSFGLEMPHTRIGQLLALKTEFEYIEKVLEKTQGFLEIRRTAEADWLRTRHAVVADIVVQQLGHGIYDRISYFLKTDLDHFSGELIRPFLKALFSQWQIRQLDIVLLRRILANLNRPSPVQKIILTIWATLEASLDEFGTARTLFQQAAEADLSDARALQQWALMEKEQGQIERARELFAQAAQADQRDAPTLQAWALMEKEQGQIERARELFAQAAQADQRDAPTLQAWA